MGLLSDEEECLRDRMELLLGAHPASLNAAKYSTEGCLKDSNRYNAMISTVPDPALLLMKTTGESPDGSAPVGRKARVFITEDHPIFRHGLAQLVSEQPDLEVCGEAGSGPEALDALRRIQTDLVVLDVSLSGTNGIETAKQLKAEHPNLPILMLSMYDESLYALRSLRAGASGYITKRAGTTEFLTAVRRILAGKIYVSQTLSEQLIYKVARGGDTGSTSPLDVLTDREMEVLNAVGEGKSTREIAESLNLSTKTIESHRLHIKEKLGLKNATEVIRFAVDWVSQQRI
jgi:DNA-binding NarL/FixJ family response regulator